MSVFGASEGKEKKEAEEKAKKEKKGPSRKSQLRGAIRSRAQKPVRFSGRSGGGVSGKKGMFSDAIGGGGIIGWVIAATMLMALIYYYSSLSGISPINNSTLANDFGCTACGPGGTPGGAYRIILPFGVVFYGAIPLLFAYGLIKRRKELEGDGEEEDILG